MPIRPGRHKLGPDNADLQVRSYREGIASKAGHDLILDVTQWEATVEGNQAVQGAEGALKVQDAIEVVVDARLLVDRP